MPISVTFDLEDNRASPAQEERFVDMTERFLSFLGQRELRATVFVVGELAVTHPRLIERIAAAGHELGLHGLRHVELANVGRGALCEELTKGRAILENVGGAAVTGFRAPIFSLTPGTAWALDEIGEAGFRYSSSVVPASNPLNGWPGSPRTPFRWPNGLIELPCAVLGHGRLSIPFLGGVYLRYLPLSLIGQAVGGLPDRVHAWTYLHPYDLDPDEPFFVLPHAGWLTSRLVHMRRRHTLARLEAVLKACGGIAPPLGDIAARLTVAPTFCV